MFPTILPVRDTAFAGLYPNGMIPVSQLVKIGPSGYLEPQAARSWLAMCDEALKNGLPLTYTYGGTNRPYGDQVLLFDQRMEACTYSEYLAAKVFGRSRFWSDADLNKPVKFRGKQYYRRRKLPNGGYPAGCATPGTSNHGKARAVDTAFDGDVNDGIGPDDALAITTHPSWPLFQRLVLRYGFSWEDKSEPWHIRYVAGDVIPAATLLFEARQAAQGGGSSRPVVKPSPATTPPPTPAPIPAVQTSTEKIVNALPVIKQGSTGFHAKLVQSSLVAHGQQVVIDGNIGSATDAQIRWFQGGHGLRADGIVGPSTWQQLLGV